MRFRGIFIAGLVAGSVFSSSVARAQLTAPPLDFGDVRINVTANDTVLLTNGSGTDATVVSCGLTNDVEFAVTNCPATVSANGTASVNLSFLPATTGLSSDTLTVTYDTDQTLDVALSGTGTEALVTLKPDAHDFGDVRVGTTSAGVSIQVVNEGTAPLTIQSAALSDTSNFNIASGPTPSFTINPGANVIYSIECTPQAVGAVQATFDITSDADSNPNPSATLDCNGVVPDITVVEPPGGGTVDFGDVLLGTTSAPQTITVRNDGGFDLTLSDVRVIFGTSAAYTIETGPVVPPDHVLIPGATASWTVTCSPVQTGANNSSFRVQSDDPDEPNKFVGLLCDGIAPNLKVDPDPVTFPDTRVCESANEITVSFENDGTAPLTIDSITVSSSVFPVLTAPPSLPTTLAPGESISLGLGFTPAAGQLFSASIDIVSDDFDNPTTQIGVTGRGEVASLVITPATDFDFGDVRTDEPPVSQTFTIRNDGEAAVRVGLVSIDDTTNFDLSVSGLPTVLLPAPAGPGSNGQTISFDIIAQPKSLGGKSATATIQTDLPCGEITTIGVAAEGVAPGLELSSGSLVFAAVDVQGGSPALQAVTVTNSGTAALTFDDIHLDEQGNTGPYLGTEYSIVDDSPVTIPAQTAVLIQVEYLPDVAGNDKAVLVLDGDLRADIPLDGDGIDRFISAARTLEFAPTFRNPEQPTTADLIVSNTGLAPLAISAAMAQETDTPDPNSLCGAGSPFSVRSPVPMTVAPGGSETIVVEFSPARISSSPLAGELIITNDDDNEPMYRVDLSGVAFLPELAVSPDSVDFGTIGAGLTTRITGDAQQLRIVNTEDVPLVVRELTIAGAGGANMDGIIDLVDFEGPVTVESMDELRVDLEFAPPEVGDYSAQLLVFVGDDPCEVKAIDLSGRALDLRLRGGGCSAGGGASTGTAALIVLAAVIGLGLWRGRESALRGRGRESALRGRGALIAGAVLSLSASASADPTRNIDIANFRPAPGVDSDHIAVETPHVGRSGSWSIALMLNYAVNPLHAESPDATVEGMTDALVAGSTGAELLASFAFADRFEVGLGLLAMRQTGDAPSFSGIQPADGAVLGDVAVYARMFIADARPLSFAASLSGTIPTGADEKFAGVEMPTVHARGIVGLDTRRVRVAMNVGARLRTEGELADVSQGHELTYGLSGALRLAEPLSVIGELYGAVGLGGGGSGATSPLEAIAGARYRMSNALGLVAGLGRGVLPGIGAPDLRAFLAVSYAPGAREVVPMSAPPKPKLVDRSDADGDHILAFEDSCPNDAEDVDGYQDEDGCPDLDNDGDGVPDGADRCPMVAEDKDGYEDSDGCVDEDNDGDSVGDKDDRCPDEPEDKDGFQDDDGCDDPDNDEDGILDLMDGCVLEPETINGNSDDDGCPDEGESALMLMADRIELLEPVVFNGTSDRLTADSKKVLDQVGAVMRAKRNILRIRINVHVHKRGKDDDTLSKRRAAAVKQYLIDWGVEPERLEAKGWGSSRPLMKGRGKQALRANDRVEIVLMELAKPRTSGRRH